MALKLSRGPNIDTDKCVKNIGNRFDLVIAAAARSRELARKHKNNQTMMPVNNTVTALLEIQEGKIGKEYLKRVR